MAMHLTRREWEGMEVADADAIDESEEVPMKREAARDPV